MDKKTYFITGIDTDAGKSVVTGLIALQMAIQGQKVITQKFIQTGCNEVSEDIVAHRKIMGIELTPLDIDRTTCPIILSFPASPHLAAKIDSTSIDTSVITKCTEKLLNHYDTVLLEGAGGPYVPLNDEVLTIDYISEHSLPVIFVTSPRLGSINHTLLSLEAFEARGIEVAMVAYNLYPPTTELITNDTRDYLQKYLAKHFPKAKWIEVTDKYKLIGEIEL